MILQESNTQIARPLSQAADTVRGIAELTEQSFSSFIDGQPFAIVEFRAASDASSRAFSPLFEAAVTRYPDVVFLKVDVEAQRALAAQLGIRALPTLMIFRDNIVVYAKAGPLGGAELDAALNAARRLDMDEARRKVAGAESVAVGKASAPTVNIDARTAADAHRHSIEHLLRPSPREPRANWTAIGARLAAGEIVAIPDAFDPAFAERMFQGLDRSTRWRAHENYAERFAYQHHNLYHPEDFPEELGWCGGIFDSPASKAFATRLSGRQCVGPTSISASWYLPGDHSLPHSDNVTTGGHYIRQLAFVWHLSKDWRSEWGGALYWCPTGTYHPSSFNTLYLFNVSPDSTHFVTHVSPYARGKRLTINGWWTGPAGTGESRRPAPDRIGDDQATIDLY